MAGLTTPTSLARLLPEAADRRPDHPAVVEPGATVSWAEADDRAGRLAAALVDAGVGAGDRVGVHCRKGVDGFVAMHAAVRIGAAAVPLDPGASPAYLAQVCALAGCRVVVTHEPCRTTARGLVAPSEGEPEGRAETGGGAGVTTLVGIGPAGTSPSGAVPTGARHVGPDHIASLDPAPPASVTPETPAYLITTSGSTGRPKSICHTHASALGHIAFALVAYDFNPDDRFADIAPHHFDISTPAVWVTPTLAATNVVVPEPHQMLPASAAELVERERVTVWYSVPYLLTQLHQRGGLEERDLTSLRWVLFGGEVFPPGILAALMGRLPGARFSNVYGPAEVNMCAVHHLDRPPDDDEPVPIGRPVDPVEIRLVDLDDANGDGPAPADGTRGEVLVRGPATMAGYWERPELTARSVVIDDDGRWYRTGDVAWRRDDGNLVFAGRRDHQVKVRGHRIELEAVEAVMEDVAGVAFAVAAVARDGQGGDVVVAGVAGTGTVGPDPDDLRRSMVNHLPAYALPQAFLEVHSAPTTGSGKLDRRSLRAEVAERYVGGERS